MPVSLLWDLESKNKVISLRGTGKPIIEDKLLRFSAWQFSCPSTSLTSNALKIEITVASLVYPEILITKLSIQTQISTRLTKANYEGDTRDPANERISN